MFSPARSFSVHPPTSLPLSLVFSQKVSSPLIATMKELSSCSKEGSSSREEEVQELTQPHEPSSQPVQDPSESNNGGNDDFNNEPVNLAWRNNNEQRDYQDPQDVVVPALWREIMDGTVNRRTDSYLRRGNYGSSRNSQSLSQNGVEFRWREILDGTGKLNISNYLGRGSFGSVYRCVFPRIDKVVGAAKIQNLQKKDGPTELMAEITTLHAANHPNVIKLLGKCLDEGNRAIVYEFMPRGSLDRHIYAEARPSGGVRLEYAVLNWDRRMNIAMGVAKALIYVHEELKTIHRDVKPANVLLDVDFVPKLTDFGLAIKMVEDKDGVEQQREMIPIKGTRGYMAPETEEFNLVSSKSDVYSYGVFLFQLFTGRKSFDGGKLNDWLKAVERREEYRFPVEGLIRLFQAARMCMNPQATARPNMRVVESMVSQAAACGVPEGRPVTRRWSI